ncbi:MAG: hypothetical protein JO286_11695 [Solirubrobacterales bacterium]|nr:hypothetical protein [Solirubrobacterales bacterium]
MCDEIAAGRDQLVALASALIAVDTTAPEVGDPPRDKARLQGYLGERLRAAGAEVEIFEPGAEALQAKALVPPGLDFAGRPQLIARQRGGGGGRPLVLNGHNDVVSIEPRDAWTAR